MSVIVFNRDGEVTDAMYQAATKKVEALNDFPLIMHDNTDIKFEVEHKKNNRFKLEGTVFSDKKVLNAKVYGSDFYTLVNTCVDKLVRQARKVKTQTIKH